MLALIGGMLPAVLRFALGGMKHRERESQQDEAVDSVVGSSLEAADGFLLEVCWRAVAGRRLERCLSNLQDVDWRCRVLLLAVPGTSRTPDLSFTCLTVP